VNGLRIDGTGLGYGCVTILNKTSTPATIQSVSFTVVAQPVHVDGPATAVFTVAVPASVSAPVPASVFVAVCRATAVGARLLRRAAAVRPVAGATVFAGTGAVPRLGGAVRPPAGRALPAGGRTADQPDDAEHRHQAEDRREDTDADT
jgi:hypothetical protein